MILGLPYTINFTDQSVPGKTPFQINPNTTDGPLSPIIASPDSSATAYHTSIVLPGFGLIQYGERLEESLVHMLENFASATPPVAPTIGQMWYDYGNKIMRVWDGSGQWQAVGSNATRVASGDEFNALIPDINYIIGAAVGTTTATAHGYGQNEYTAITGRVPTTAEWLQLINSVRKAGGLQGTDVSGLVDTDFTLPGNDAVQFGMMKLIQLYQSLQSIIATVKANRNTISPAALEVDLSGVSSTQRTTPWSGTIEHQVQFRFASAALARAFFNTGGYISVNAAADQTVNGDDVAVATLLTHFGTTNIRAFVSDTTGTGTNTSVGFYSMTTSYQTLRTLTEGGNTVKILALYDPVAFVLTIRTTFTAARTGTGTKLYNDGVIGGRLKSNMVMHKASSTYVNDPAIAYPPVTTVKALSV